MSKSLAVYAIPVRPYVRQFMLYEFGQAQPHALHQNSLLGCFVGMKLEKQPFRQLQRPERPPGPAFELTLPTALKHYVLTPEAAKQLGSAFNKMFRLNLVMWVKGQIAATNNERQALVSFYNNYNIDPSDADLEMLRKIYRDYKDKVLRDNEQGQRLFQPEGRGQMFREYALAS